MKLIIETKDFEHLEDKSHYNHNYYKNKDGMEVLEICHEYHNFQEYRLITGEKWELLGCSYDNMSKIQVEIDFRLFYT